MNAWLLFLPDCLAISIGRLHLLQMFWSAHEAPLVVLAIDRRETYCFLNSAIDSSVTRKVLEVWLALSHSNSTNRRTDLVLHSSWRAASAMVLVSPFARAVRRAPSAGIPHTTPEKLDEERALEHIVDIEEENDIGLGHAVPWILMGKAKSDARFIVVWSDLPRESAAVQESMRSKNSSPGTVPSLACEARFWIDSVSRTTLSGQ
jgi:hypothetical protein